MLLHMLLKSIKILEVSCMSELIYLIVSYCLYCVMFLGILKVRM